MSTEEKEIQIMALTRKMLKGMSLTEEQIDTIIEAHTETVNALKDERDNYVRETEELKKNSEGLAGEKKKVEELQEKVKELEKANSEAEDFKSKYEDIKKQFDDYKAGIEVENANRNKTNALKNLLKDIGVSEKHLDTVLKVSDISSITLDDEGNINDADKLKESLKTEWEDFIVTEGVKGAKTAQPPKNDGGSKMTKEEIMKIADRNERQKAISENHEIFGY